MHFPSIKEFNYELPDSAVAKYPLTERDQSKLLVWDNTQVTDSTFSNLPGFLPESSMLVFNNTRVIRARLHFFKSTGANIEIFCLEPTLPHDYVLSFAQTSSCRWKCIVGNKKRWKAGVLEMCVELGCEEGGGERATGRLGECAPVPERSGPRAEGSRGRGVVLREESLLVPERSRGVVLRAEMVGEMEGGYEIEFSWDNPNFTFAEILEAVGNIPIPPYLHRESEEIDLSVYQTVYAKIKGSVAAPTAGLHFTDKVFKELAERHISCEELTLHVGAGTFQPVKSESVGEHRMHTEYFSVNKSTISKLIAHPGSIIAVGTTSVRTLESLYWIGMKIIANTSIEPDSLAVTQWEPYQERGGDGAQAEGLGDWETGRLGDWETGRLGDWGTRGLGDWETGRLGDWETGRLGDWETGRLGDWETGRLGEGEDEWTRGRGDERASVPERSRGVALQAILDWLDKRELLTLETSTQIMILPGYRFRIISGLVTNFHQPQSTLLLLISAILGEDWKRVYAHALEKGYRFLSYGDANLYLLRHEAETNIK